MANRVDLGSVVGPQGPKGEPGNTGPTGEKGNTGAIGPKGETGVGIRKIVPVSPENSEKVPGLRIVFNNQSETESATYDYVQIFYEDNGQMKSLEKIGGTIGAKTVDIPSKVFWLYWHTDISDCSFYGFSIDRIEEIQVDKTMITSSSAVLPSYSATNLMGNNYPESPNHGKYGNNINLLWKYIGEMGKVYEIYLTNGESYTLVAPTGPKGDTGAAGPAGPKGDTGPNGKDGKSAYAYAKEGGYTDTESNFIADLSAIQRLAAELVEI